MFVYSVCSVNLAACLQAGHRSAPLAVESEIDPRRRQFSLPFRSTTQRRGRSSKPLLSAGLRTKSTVTGHRASRSREQRRLCVRSEDDGFGPTLLAPSLNPGDVVILDNLNVHKSPRAARALAERGAWFLFLPKYSPDLNPIEMAFAKLKALLRKAKARTYEALWRAVGDICALFDPQKCRNYLKDAGYVAD